MEVSRNLVSRTSRVFVISIVATALLAGCARPPSATVREGADPFNVDKDVVFRTTYYFRVFDYCVARRLKKGQFDKVVVPLTDSLYRFRMTGKANSLLSNVKFESGTLMAWEIEPFGAKVEYDPESGRHRVVSPREVTADARRAAIKQDIYEMLSMFRRLNKELKENEEGSQTSENATLTGNVLSTLSSELQKKVARLASLDSGPTDGDVPYADSARTPLDDARRSALLKEEVQKIVDLAFRGEKAATRQALVDEGFGTGSTTLDESDPGRPGFVERAAILTIERAAGKRSADMRISDVGQKSAVNAALVPYRTADNLPIADAIERLVRSLSARLTQSENYLAPLLAAAGQPQAIQCPEDAPVRRGFQVLGPEGWRTFNQDERLLLAMSSSAQPLVSTLKDLSNRVLSARDSPSAELLPIVLEQKRLSEAGRKLDVERTKPTGSPKEVAESICRELVESSADERSICDEQ